MRWIDKVTKGQIPYQYGEALSARKRKKSYLLCPEPGCGKPVRFGCTCPIQDQTCENGHHWHLEFVGVGKKRKQIVTKGEGAH